MELQLNEGWGGGGEISRNLRVFQGGIEHRSKKLFAYGGKEINVIGQFGAEMSVGNAKSNFQVILVKHGRFILQNEKLQATYNKTVLASFRFASPCDKSSLVS